MKIALILMFLAPAFAMADSRYECVPVVEHESITKAVILDKGANPELELWGPSGLISKTAAEYGDDVDVIFYFSEAADVNVYFYWVEMLKRGEADGQIIIRASGDKITGINAHCKSL